MHNFKIGDLALYNIKDEIIDEVVIINSNHMLDARVHAFGDVTDKGFCSGYRVIMDDFNHELMAADSELTPLPKPTTWQNIKAEIFKPISVIES